MTPSNPMNTKYNEIGDVNRPLTRACKRKRNNLNDTEKFETLNSVNRPLTRGWKQKHKRLKEEKSISCNNKKDPEYSEKQPTKSQPRYFFTIINTKNCEDVFSAFQSIRQPSSKVTYVDNIQYLKIRSKLKPSKIVFRCSYDYNNEEVGHFRKPRKRKKTIMSCSKDTFENVKETPEQHSSDSISNVPSRVNKDDKKELHDVNSKQQSTHDEFHVNSEALQTSQMIAVGNSRTEINSNPASNHFLGETQTDLKDTLMDFLIDIPVSDPYTKTPIDYPFADEENVFEIFPNLPNISFSSEVDGDIASTGLNLIADGGMEDVEKVNYLNNHNSIGLNGLQMVLSDNSMSDFNGDISSDSESDEDTFEVEEIDFKNFRTNPLKVLKIRDKIKRIEQRLLVLGKDDSRWIQLNIRLNDHKVNEALEIRRINLKGLIMERERLEYYINKIKLYLHRDYISATDSNYLLQKVNMTLNDRVSGNMDTFIDAVLAHAKVQSM